MTIGGHTECPIVQGLIEGIDVGGIGGDAIVQVGDVSRDSIVQIGDVTVNRGDVTLDGVDIILYLDNIGSVLNHTAV